MIKKYKIFLSICIALFLSANITQHYFHLIKLSPLSGLVVNNDKPQLTLHNWFSGSFQQKIDDKIKNNFGLSNAYIRLNNQISYSLYKKAIARDVVIGEDNYLYEQNYINAYYGIDFIGEDSIYNIIHKLKIIQDSLEYLNKHLLLIFCPGKASFYPEYIPLDLRKEQTAKTNMRTYINLAEQEHLNYLNIYDMFLNLKKNSKHILYPKYGIHWSSFGEYLAFEQIRSTLKTKFDLHQSEIGLEKIERSVVARDRDNDMIEGLNLPINPKNDSLSYPVLKVYKRAASLPNAVVISDSFYWGIFSKGWCDLLFNKNEFWYYFKESYNNKNNEVVLCKDINIRKAINDNDVFIIMSTEATISNFGWDVINALYAELTHTPLIKKNHVLDVKRVEFWKNFIRNNPQWHKDAEIRAMQNNISLDSSITLDAIYQTNLGN